MKRSKSALGSKSQSAQGSKSKSKTSTSRPTRAPFRPITTSKPLAFSPPTSPSISGSHINGSANQHEQSQSSAPQTAHRFFSTSLSSQIIASPVHLPFNITHPDGVTQTTRNFNTGTSLRKLHMQNLHQNAIFSTSKRSFWSQNDEDDDGIPLATQAKGGKGKPQRKTQDQPDFGFDPSPSQPRSSSTFTDGKPVPVSYFGHNAAKSPNSAAAFRDMDSEQEPSAPSRSNPATFSSSWDDWHGHGTAGSGSSKHNKAPGRNSNQNTRPKQSVDDDPDPTFDSFDAPSDRTGRRDRDMDWDRGSRDGGFGRDEGRQHGQHKTITKKSSFDSLDDEIGDNEQAAESSWQWPSRPSGQSSSWKHNDHNDQNDQNDQISRPARNTTRSEISQPQIDQRLQYNEFSPYQQKKSPNQAYEDGFQTQGHNNRHNSSHTDRFGKFTSGNRHHNQGFIEKGGQMGDQNRAIKDWQRFETQDQDHDVRHNNGSSFNSIRHGNRDRDGGGSGSGWGRDGGRDNFGHSRQNKFNSRPDQHHDAGVTVDLEAWGDLAAKLPSEEVLRKAIAKYLPATPFVPAPTTPQFTNGRQNRHNGGFIPGAEMGMETFPGGTGTSEDVFLSISKLIESIQASLKPNSGLNHDSVQAHIGGRLNNAIGQVYSQYRSRGLLLFVDVFHPWLNIVHWTKILNSLISSANYQVATLLFETYILPKETSVEEDAVLEQINNPLGDLDLGLDMETHEGNSPVTSKSLKNHSSRAQKHRLITSVDKKLMTEIITAYSRCKPPQELLKLLSNLEQIGLLPSDPAATKHLFATICSDPSEYDQEYLLFGSNPNNIDEDETKKKVGPGSSPTSAQSQSPSQGGQGSGSGSGQLLLKRLNKPIHPFYKSTLIHPYITFSTLMSFYHDFRQYALFKLITNVPRQNGSLASLAAHMAQDGDNDQDHDHGQENDQNGQKRSKFPLISVPTLNPFQPKTAFLHSRGQLVGYSQMYAQTGFLGALHGLLTESLQNQGIVALPQMNSLISLATSMNRLDYLFGVVRNRYKYVNRHVSGTHNDQQSAVSLYFHKNNVSPLSLPWSNLNVPYGPMNQSTAAGADTDVWGHAKDHFSHSIDYNSLNLPDLGPSSATVDETVGPNRIVKAPVLDANGEPQKAKSLQFPKYPLQKRFVLVSTALGMGVEVYTNESYYYQTHGKLPPPPKMPKAAKDASQQNQPSTPFQPEKITYDLSPAGVPVTKFNPAAAIAAITPNSNHYTSSTPPADAPNANSHSPFKGVNVGIASVNTSTVNDKAKRRMIRFDSNGHPLSENAENASSDQNSPNSKSSSKPVSFNDISNWNPTNHSHSHSSFGKDKSVSKHYWDILRHLQPDPVLVISLRPNPRSHYKSHYKSSNGHSKSSSSHDNNDSNSSVLSKLMAEGTRNGPLAGVNNVDGEVVVVDDEGEDNNQSEKSSDQKLKRIKKLPFTVAQNPLLPDLNTGRRRRHIVDTESKRRHDIYLPDVASELNQNDKNNQVHISVMSILPSSSSSPTTPTPPQNSSNSRSHSHSHPPSPNPIHRLQTLLSAFSSTTTSSPLFQSAQSTQQLFQALAQSRSYGLLSKATTFYTHHNHVYHPNQANPAPAPAKTVKALLNHDIFNNALLAPTGQILSPHLRLLSRLLPHNQPPPVPVADSDTEDLVVRAPDGQGNQTAIALSPAVVSTATNLTPYTNIPFTFESPEKNLVNSPFDGVVVGTSIADLARKKAKKVNKPKFHLPLFLIPFLVHYEDGQNHPEDQFQIQAAMHLMGSFGNSGDEVLGKFGKEWSQTSDHKNAYYTQAPSLLSQLRLQYTHIYQSVPKYAALDGAEVAKQKESVRMGVLVGRRLVLGAVNKIINFQNKSQSRIFTQYEQLVQGVLTKDRMKVSKRVNGFRHDGKMDGDDSEQEFEFQNGQKRGKNDQNGQHSSQHAQDVMDQIESMFKMSNTYTDAGTYGYGATEGNTDGKLTLKSKSNKHIFLPPSSLQELKTSISTWSAESQTQVDSLMSLLQTYTYTPHPEVVEEFFGSILPLLIDLRQQLSLTPQHTEQLCRIGIDLALSSHFHSALTPTPLAQHKTKRAMANAMVSFSKEETDLVTRLGDSELTSLVTDSYLGSLGLPQVSDFTPFSGTEVIGMDGIGNDGDLDGESGVGFQQVAKLKSENCSFSPPHLKTAPSALHTRLLKLLATLSEVTKGTTNELNCQLSLASGIADQFSRKGDLNSTLIWCTLVAHMKQNINKTLERELATRFGEDDDKAPGKAQKGSKSDSADLTSPFQLIAHKVQLASTAAELLKPVDQLKSDQKMAILENNHENTNNNFHHDADSDFHRTLQQHFDSEMNEPVEDGSGEVQNDDSVSGSGNVNQSGQHEQNGHREQKDQKDQSSTTIASHRKQLKKILKQSGPPSLPFSFYPSGTMSDEFILGLNQGYVGKNGVNTADGIIMDQNSGQNAQHSSQNGQNGRFAHNTNNRFNSQSTSSGPKDTLIPLSKPLPSPFQGGAPPGIKPVTSLGQILQLLPDLPLTPSTKSAPSLQKTLQQSIRSFEHALLASETSGPLPKLMPSLAYLNSLQCLFQAVVYSNATQLSTYVNANAGRDDEVDNSKTSKGKFGKKAQKQAAALPDSTSSSTPDISSFSNVVNASLATYHMFWHLLASVEQKQAQHAIGVDTAALLGPVAQATSNSNSGSNNTDSSNTQSRSFIYPTSSPALTSSLDQFLNQNDSFSLDTSMAQVLTIASRLAAIPSPKKMDRNQSHLLGDGDDDDEMVQDSDHNDVLDTHQSLLAYTDRLINNIVSIWDPKSVAIASANANANAKENATQRKKADNSDQDDELSPPLDQDLLALRSPFAATPNSAASSSNKYDMGKYGDRQGSKPKKAGLFGQTSHTDPLESNVSPHDQIYDPTIQNGPLHFVKPTPALVAAINTYVNNRIKYVDLATNATETPITLQTYSRIQCAVKAYVTNNAPSTMQQLEAFKMHKDHQKFTALSLLEQEVKKDHVHDMLLTKQRRAVLNGTDGDEPDADIDQGSAQIKKAKRTKTQITGTDDAVLATDFALVTPTTDLELQIDMVLEQIQTGVGAEDGTDGTDTTDGTDSKSDSSLTSPLHTSHLNRLLHGQYPYPLTLTLSKTSALSFGKSKTQNKKRKNNDVESSPIDHTDTIGLDLVNRINAITLKNRQHANEKMREGLAAQAQSTTPFDDIDYDIYSGLSLDENDSELSNLREELKQHIERRRELELEQPTWFPTRGQLLSKLGFSSGDEGSGASEVSESDNTDTSTDVDSEEGSRDADGEESNEESINLVKLDEKASSIRLDSHLNTHDVIGTLFQVSDSLNARLGSIRKRIEQIEGMLEQDNGRAYQSILSDLTTELDTLVDTEEVLTQRSGQAKMLLQLFAKGQNDSYLGLLTEHVEQLKTFAKPILPRGIGGGSDVKVNNPVAADNGSPGSPSTTSTAPKIQRDYLPVPFFDQNSAAAEKSDKSPETNPEGEETVADLKANVTFFSFQDYHNTMVKGCFNAVTSTLDTRQMIQTHGTNILTPDQKQQQAKPNPALFLLQPNRTLTAKEARAFEMFLQNLD